ncbi:MAG: mechanosensitive ion channel [Bacteroidales bacterium]|nr:mechanosensitive ion channel [Bacteroidales bacterium]
MKIRWLFDINDLLLRWGIQENYADTLNILFGIFNILLIAYLSDVIARQVILTILKRIVKKTSTTWDDIIFEKKVFNRLSHLAPALVLYYFSDFVLTGHTDLATIIQAILKIYMTIITLRIINSLFNALQAIYETLPMSKDRPIKGYIQVALIIFYAIGIILILSIILGKSPAMLLTGIGALAAVLILVFKDTILGFVASIQLSANNMVRLGDWISMPNHGADGTVIEITLNTVKVQNWDKTISTIPTYSLVSESFGNWRGMEESGGRRIKRHVNIDMRSVKFCTPEMLERFKSIRFLNEYVPQRLKEIEEFNKANAIDESIVVNGRRMTNLGTFRKYLEFYLKHHPMIHPGLTMLVRHLQPSETGIPIEIYAFSKDQAWANYESIQADIFDHILAVLPEFELSVFQNPTGSDFRSLSNTNPE